MREVIMTKLLSLLAVVALFAGCASPLPENVSRVAPQPQQTKVTGEDALARDLIKADVWEAIREDRQKSWQNPINFLDADFTTVFPAIDGIEGVSEAAVAMAPRLLNTTKSTVKMELPETYPTTPATQSALVNAIDQPVKLVLK